MEFRLCLSVLGHPLGDPDIVISSKDERYRLGDIEVSRTEVTTEALASHRLVHVEGHGGGDLAREGAGQLRIVKARKALRTINLFPIKKYYNKS
jgi:hypothetical protein